MSGPIPLPTKTQRWTVLRSPHAHARILDIDVSGVLDVEGVHLVSTHDDLTGPMAEPLPLLIPHPTLTHGRTPPALANGEVNHVGEPIVMVVATDRYVAEDVCDRIVVTYEELPVVVGVDAAREATHWVHENIPSNVAAHHHQETGDVEPALAASPHTLSFTQYIERSACMPMEGKGVHAKWDADDASLRVYTSTQASTSVRAAIAAKLELSLDKVEVIAPDVGGGFGVKIVHPWPEELLVPLAAIALQAEVKWSEDRREHFISSAHERQQRQEITVGYDDDGRITAEEATELLAKKREAGPSKGRFAKKKGGRKKAAGARKGTKRKSAGVVAPFPSRVPNSIERARTSAKNRFAIPAAAAVSTNTPSSSTATDTGTEAWLSIDVAVSSFTAVATRRCPLNGAWSSATCSAAARACCASSATPLAWTSSPTRARTRWRETRVKVAEGVP